MEINKFSSHGHVMDVSDYRYFCRFCGASLEQVQDGEPCELSSVLGKERCTECSLIRECLMTSKGATCSECIENIREGVALRS